MHTRILTFALPLASLLCATGCQVDMYHQQADDPHAGKLQHVVGPNYLLHPRSQAGLCLEVRDNKAANNQEVWLATCNGNPNQRWAFADAANGGSTITGIGGLCLDVHNWNTQEGAPVSIAKCGNDQPNQTYKHYENGNFREVQSGKCLMVGSVQAEQQARIGSCVEGNVAQVWTETQ